MGATQAELEAYLKQKIGKHVGSLTPEQVDALKKSIAEGRAKRVSNVRDDFNKFAKMTDKERKEAALDERLERLAQLKEQRTARAETFIKDAPLTIGMVESLATEMDTLSEYEFMRITDSGKRVLHSASSIRKSAAELEDKYIARIRKALSEIPAAEAKRDADKVEELLDKVETGITELVSRYYAVGMKAKEAAESAVATMSDQAVKAWVKENPDKASKILSKLNETSNSLLKVGEKGGKAVPGLSEGIKAFRTLKEVVLDRQIEAQIAARQVRKEKSKHVSGYGFQIAELDPTIMAKRVAQKQIANFEQVLKLIGAVVEEFFPPWDIVESLLKSTGKAYFEQRVKLAALEAKMPPEPEKDPGKEAVKQLVDDAEKEVWDVVGDMVEQGDFMGVMADALGGISIEGVATKVIEKVSAKVLTLLVKYLPVEPGQPVNGAELQAEARKLVATVKISKVGDPALDHQKLERPEADSQGRKVSRFMQTNRDHDSKGNYFWVEIEGQIGKLYVDGDHKGEFIENAGGSMMFPTRVGNRDIDEVIGQAPTGMGDRFHLEVRIKDLIGYIDAGATTFTAYRPAKLADWSQRKIDVHSYREGATTVEGDWTRVERPGGGLEYYLFTAKNGRREWGDSESPTGNNGDKMVKVFAPTKLTKQEIGALA